MPKPSFRLIVLTGLAVTLLLTGPIAAEPNRKPSPPWTLQAQLGFTDYANSPQKSEGMNLAVSLQRRLDRHQWQIGYEQGAIQTFQPPLPSDLDVGKFHLHYRYQWNDQWQLALGGLVIDDNIAPTDSGKVYRLGLSYTPDPRTRLSLDRYLSDYAQFRVHQTDLSLSRRLDLGGAKANIGLIAKAIDIDGRQTNGYTRNAQDDYLTLGLNVMLNRNDWFGGGGVFVGERAFAVMNEGARVQHHAMEFDRTYRLSLGKRFDNASLALHLVHQRATELPINNAGVELDSVVLQFNRSF